MKKINGIQYLLAYLFFFGGALSYYITSGVHNTFITVFIGIIFIIGFLNTSSILFYKTLKSNDEYLKIVFSFIHIICLMIIAFIFV